MRSNRLTDDHRVLLALMHGYDVRCIYRPGTKFSSAPSDTISIEKDGVRLRCVSVPSVNRACNRGLVEQFAEPRPGESWNGCDIWHYLLTDSGRTAAQAIEGISIERVIAPPKSKAKPAA